MKNTQNSILTKLMCLITNLFWISLPLGVVIMILYIITEDYKSTKERISKAEYKIETPDSYYYSVIGTLIKDGQCIVFNNIYDNKPQTVCGSYNYRKIND